MTCECGRNDHDLIASLQTELDFYKNEFKQLRQSAEQIIKTNERQSCNDDEIRKDFAKAEANYQTYKQISTDAINNLKRQIECINTERLTYYNLWKISQQTICGLESEINQYLKQSNTSNSAQQPKDKMQASDKPINENDSGKSVEMDLERSKIYCETQMKALDKKYNDLAVEHIEVLSQLKNIETVLRENRFEMVELRKERDDYKKQLNKLCEQQRRYQQRESIAHAKIQDALQMVETALNEKNAALQREKEIREECDQLALTIGSVMEEASNKVEGNIDDIKTDYSQRMCKLEGIIKKLIVSKDTIAKSNCLSRKQLEEMQANFSDIMVANSTLNSDLQTASKTIVELEMKLKAYEKLIACEQATTDESEQRSTQLRILLDNNMKLKQTWKNTYNEMTEKLQKELVHLRSENSQLIATNQKLCKELLKLSKS